ncbi:MAG: hypothetical protein ACK4OF_05760 [Aquificaceae bacterium]
MGLFIEDLLNFGNLIDAELEIRLEPKEFKKAYPELDFEIRDGLISIRLKRKLFLFEKTQEVRLSEAAVKVRKGKDQRQWTFFRLISKEALKKLLNMQGFTLEEDMFGVDVMPAVVHTETYEKIPRQFREKLLINSYRIGKGHLSVFFKFER